MSTIDEDGKWYSTEELMEELGITMEDLEASRIWNKPYKMRWLDYPTLDDAIDVWQEDPTELPLLEWLGLTSKDYSDLRSKPWLEDRIRCIQKEWEEDRKR